MMKSQFAKQNPLVLKEAISHYLNKKPAPFTFMSLWSDEEPYPLDEVIEVQKARIVQLVDDVRQYPNNESYKTSLFTANKLLNRLEKRREELNR